MKKKNRKQRNLSGKHECPICETQQVLIEHHIKGRDIPDANHPSNLADICDNCHRKIHLGRIVIEGWYQTTNGKELFWHEGEKDSFTGKDSKTYIIGK